MNMSDMVTPSSHTPGLFARVIGVIFSPVETFKSVVAAPRPVGVLFIVCLVIGLSAGLPQFTETGRRASLDMQVQSIEQFTGQPPTPEMYAQMESRAAMGAYMSMFGVFLAVPVITLFFSALYWALFNVILGGTATFGQVVGVTAHATVIGALGALVSTPIQLLQGSMSMAGPFNLGALVPMLDPGSGLAMFLGGVTFFGLWESVVTGLGLSVLYKRAPTGLIITVLAIHLGLAALRTVGFSAFMGR